MPGHWIEKYCILRFVAGEFDQEPEHACFGSLLLFLSWTWQGDRLSWYVQSYLAAGLLNWICVTFNRSLLPTVSWRQIPAGLARADMAGVHRYVLPWVAME